MSKYSLLQNLKKENFFENPFPHLIIENALPNDIYQDLSENIPNEYIKNINLNNSRGNVFIKQLKTNARYETWIEFLKYHQSEEFFSKIISIFDNEIKKKHGKIFENLKKLKINPIFKNKLSNDMLNLNLDSYYCYNTPVIEESSIRGIHLDFYNKLHIGLFYLRSKNDESIGGNLALHKWKENYDLTKKKQILYSEKFKNLEIHTEKIKEIPYKRNTFFLAINSIDALHSVTPRLETKNIRQFCYFYSSLNYDLKNFKASLVEKMSIKSISIFQKIKILLFFLKEKILK